MDDLKEPLVKDPLVTVRDATALDLPAIAAIQARSPAAAQWDPATYLAYRSRVAMIGDRVVAFVVTRQVGPDECEILTLAVDPAERRTGLARQLLADTLAGSKGSWFLEVRASNAAAIQLYKSAGFEPAGRRSRYYDEPAEDGIVMRFFS